MNEKCSIKHLASSHSLFYFALWVDCISIDLSDPSQCFDLRQKEWSREEFSLFFIHFLFRSQKFENSWKSRAVDRVMDGWRQTEKGSRTKMCEKMDGQGFLCVRLSLSLGDPRERNPQAKWKKRATIHLHNIIQWTRIE